MSASTPAIAVFHRTRDGLLAASLGDTAFLGVRQEDGQLRIAHGSRIDKPREQWVPQDFHGFDRLVKDEDGFRSHVETLAEHRRELSALNHAEFRSHAQTPWGCADFSYRYGEGITRHSTPSHGGFQLDAARNALVYAAYRNRDGWYEEDCQWSKVAAAFPSLFTSFERRCADETLRNFEPDAYERVHGVTLAPGESHVKDERRFKRDHATDWIVISAIRSPCQPGLVECVATLGGRRDGKQERRFLVPIGEYEVGRFGFVIDPARHAVTGVLDDLATRGVEPTT